MRVVSAGPRLLVQDLGRPGLAHLGVSPSGALDPLLLHRANALVGNRRGAPCLEVLLSCVLELTGAVAVTGGTGPETTWLAPGERLQVEAAGLVAYVAVRGGFRATPVLGSCSTDTLGGLGPAPLRDGDPLVVGDDPGPGGEVPELPAHQAIRVLPGPRHDGLVGTTWTVGADVSRTAVRLDGPALPALPEALPEGLVRGAVQLPPSGRPVVMLADHPVTGGYPVVGVVHPDDLRALVQTRPGGTVTFAPAPPA